MFIESIKNMPKIDRENYIHNLKDAEKATLLTEISEDKKKANDEKIRLETQKASLEEQLAEQTEQMKSLGVSSYEELDIEINKLEDELDKSILEYFNALSEE